MGFEAIEDFASAIINNMPEFFINTVIDGELKDEKKTSSLFLASF